MRTSWRFKDISITKKLHFIIGAMVLLIVVELFFLGFVVHTLSSIRAVVGAEGMWSKAQKDAVYHLRKFQVSKDEKDYVAFKKFMQVPLGDRQARIELLKKEPDFAIIRMGMLLGKLHNDDIDGVSQLIIRFKSNRYISRCLQIWASGDSVMAGLMPLAHSLHQNVVSPNPSLQIQQSIIQQVDDINEKVTLLEDEFSYVLGEGCRWMEDLLLKIILVIAITVGATGIFLTVLITQGITNDLGEIQKTTSKIIKGDLNARAQILSNNEIGKVAAAVNQMTEQLIATNRELEQVAYIASHDLQIPLMTIRNYANVLEKQYKNALDENASECLASISKSAERMQLLVKDMLDHSKIGNDKKIVSIDCNKEIAFVLDDMDALISACNARVLVRNLPVINGYWEMKMLFQNLISNAIKFRKADVQPVVTISASETDLNWQFLVNDNGIGIDSQYHKRIFTIFQKLHNEQEYAGTGIGLAHCKKIVEMHRGKIWVHSEPGKGSTFYFTIPKA